MMDRVHLPWSWNYARPEMTSIRRRFADVDGYLLQSVSYSIDQQVAPVGRHEHSHRRVYLRNPA